MADTFTVDAARALGGPDWLMQRRVAAAEQVASLSWPTAEQEIWRYSRIGELDLARYRPFVEEELGRAGDERAPGLAMSSTTALCSESVEYTGAEQPST